MARLDIKSFEEGIKKCDEMIAKWEAKRKRLEEKIENTIECPKCHEHWDKLYIRRQYMHYDYCKGGYFGDETHQHCRTIVELECPLCLQTIKEQIAWQCNEHPSNTGKTEETICEYPSQEYLYNVATKKVEKSKQKIKIKKS